MSWRSFAGLVLLGVTIAQLNGADSAPPRTAAGIVSRIKRSPVHSTALAAVGYSRHLRALEIEFVNGAIYRYFDVPVSVYRELVLAESKARYYDENIRRRYRSAHVRPRVP